MAFAIGLSVLLVVGAGAGVLARRRVHRSRPPSGLDAEAEAHHVLVRLTAGLVPPDARAWSAAGEEAGRALTSAAECHRRARTRLSTARTPADYAEATRAATEGLAHLRTARTALEPVGATTARVVATARDVRADAGDHGEAVRTGDRGPRPPAGPATGTAAGGTHGPRGRDRVAADH
ncbi:hypothetical protein ACH4F6_22535 [Streptomyces sp. NPDC017936]|uniref:hypothetical protein n=1 Tax=Streptomyces sp. NPDC017936 TaxID=3365016 RepID=UPI0037893EF1